MNGEFYFTSKRIPLLAAVEDYQKGRTIPLFPADDEDDADFGCDSGICGV